MLFDYFHNKRNILPYINKRNRPGAGILARDPGPGAGILALDPGPGSWPWLLLRCCCAAVALLLLRCCCAAVLLCCCAAVLLCCCAAALLRCCCSYPTVTTLMLVLLYYRNYISYFLPPTPHQQTKVPNPLLPYASDKIVIIHPLTHSSTHSTHSLTP